MKPNPLSILILEDNPIVMKLLRIVLQGQRFRVLETGTAAEALSCFREHRTIGNIHLFIADLCVPDGSGIQVAATLWSQDPTLRVIVASGYPRSLWSVSDAAAAAVLPPQSFALLEKPFVPCTLLAMIASMVNQPEASTSS